MTPFLPHYPPLSLPFFLTIPHSLSLSSSLSPILSLSSPFFPTLPHSLPFFPTIPHSLLISRAVLTVHAIMILASQVLLNGGKEAYSQQMDVYAFGMFIYYLSSFMTPFENDTRPITALLEEGRRPELPSKVRTIKYTQKMTIKYSVNLPYLFTHPPTPPTYPPTHHTAPHTHSSTPPPPHAHTHTHTAPPPHTRTHTHTHTHSSTPAHSRCLN